MFERTGLPYLGVHSLFGKDSGFCEMDILKIILKKKLVLIHGKL